jgi:class 3 adenylate cyclase
MTKAHGDAEAVAIVRAFRNRALQVLGPGDELVKTIGDAVMLRFPTPRPPSSPCGTAAARAGRARRGAVATRRRPQRPRRGRRRRLLRRRGHLAAHVAGEAGGGQLLVTTPTALAARDLGALVTHVGSVELRNVSESVDVWDVRVGEGDDTVVTDPVCHMRVPTTGHAAIALDWSGRRLRFCGLARVSRFAADPERYPRSR